MEKICFSVMPRGAWEDFNEFALAIWTESCESGMYDGSFDAAIYEALDEFGIFEIMEGAFEYDEENGPFDSKKFIEFMSSKGFEFEEHECKINE